MSEHMKYQVITLNGKPAIVETANMNGDMINPDADYAPFNECETAQSVCNRFNNGELHRQDISWSKNDTNPSQPQPK